MRPEPSVGRVVDEKDNLMELAIRNVNLMRAERDFAQLQLKELRKVRTHPFLHSRSDVAFEYSAYKNYPFQEVCRLEDVDNETASRGDVA